jgi:glycosyltransferase involved in cell wall biosynthesis
MIEESLTMAQNPRISVAMCSYNGGRYIGAQLESIAAQHRHPDELVVCDDGSSDDCVEIVREFAQRVSFPTRLVVNDKNLRTTKNFEKAISLCQGEIVALADQDDVWYRNKLERIEKAFLRSNAVVATFSDADLIDEDSRLQDVRLWAVYAFNVDEQEQFASGHALNILVKHAVATGATMAFRREIFDLLAPIPSNHFHDRWISFLLAARGQIELIPEPLMQYRQHQAQQIGPAPRSLWERTARARRRPTAFYFEEMERFHELYERLENRKANFPYGECAQKEIEGKISHLKHRARLPQMRVARRPNVLREAFNAGYWRYGAGWKSIAKDLVFL